MTEKRLMGLRPGSGPKKKRWQIELANWEGRQETERRENDRGPRKTDRIFRGDKRKHVISLIADMMKDWRWTPFEKEGPTRIGLREALCLSGYDWQRADDEAAEIVGECLKSVPRPKWAEGQWQYTIPRENCQRCTRPIDEEDYAAGNRYCSPVCFNAARVHSAAYHEIVMTWQASIVRYHAWKAAQPKRTCQREGCGKKYQPSSEDQRYCSTECHGLDRRTIERRICENPDCRKEFAFENYRLGRAGLWCSPECYQIRRRVGKEFVQCGCVGCTNEFQPINDGQKYCSEKCRDRQWSRDSRAKKKAAEAAAKSDHPIHKLFDAA